MDLTAVFHVTREIEEIGAREGDRLVIGEGGLWPVALARQLGHADARWAFRAEYTRLLFTLPSSHASEYAAFRHRWLIRSSGQHLRLVE